MVFDNPVKMDSYSNRTRFYKDSFVFVSSVPVMRDITVLPAPPCLPHLVAKPPHNLLRHYATGFCLGCGLPAVSFLILYPVYLGFLCGELSARELYWSCPVSFYLQCATIGNSDKIEHDSHERN